MSASGVPPENFEAMREKMHRQMLSVVSHDLKTPLATMIGSLEIFTRMYDKLSPEKREMLVQSALTEAYRLDQFITNILDMAKLEWGMVSAKKEKTELKSLIGDCVTRLSPRANHFNIKISSTTPHSNLTTDAMLLSRAIGLLLDNAIKHAGKHSTNIEIEFGREQEGYAIRVRDYGPGIPAGREEEIFSKYSRIARNDQQNAGTGLGLAICRQMMEMLGGRVTAHNAPAGGAIFTLLLP